MTKAQEVIGNLELAENSISDVAELLSAAGCFDLHREAMELMSKIQSRTFFVQTLTPEGEGQ